MNILITGASSGLGRALAVIYAAEGIHLFLIGRNRERLKQTKDACTAKGAEVSTKVLDVRDRAAVEKWILSIDKKTPLDMVIANAGVSGGTLKKNDVNDEYAIFDTNIQGVLNTIQPLIPAMMSRKKGKIVIISSMASFRGMATSPAYSASKACVRVYGEALNNYLKAFGVGVSVVCPGFIKTPLTDENTFKMPFKISAEVAAAKIKKALAKNRKYIIFPKILYFLLQFANHLPFGLDDLLFSRLSVGLNDGLLKNE